MDFTLQKLIGIHSFKLTQRRFEDGKLYVCAICLLGELISIDVRFFTEDGNILRPSRQGFRIHKGDFDMFRNVLNRNAVDVGDTILWEKESKKLFMRYCDDQYGRAIDFRYFKSSPKYTGWEKRGIRLQLDDYEKLRLAVIESNVLTHRDVPKIDILAGKEISSLPQHVPTERASPIERHSRNANLSDVNGALRAFIEEL